VGLRPIIPTKKLKNYKTFRVISWVKFFNALTIPKTLTSELLKSAKVA